ncbi:MAG: LysM peptidoglycan-binding domain-containing protein [Caldilineaceae bacterium]
MVRAGELLATIAQRYDVDVADLAALNGIDDPSLIVPGQSSSSPACAPGQSYGAPALSAELPADGGYYTVQPGDSLHHRAALCHDAGRSHAAQWTIRSQLCLGGPTVA